MSESNATAPAAPAATPPSVTSTPASPAAPAAATSTAVAPNVTVNFTPPATAPAAPAVQAPPAAAPPTGAPAAVPDPEAVNRIVQERLDRDRKARLKELGAESEDEVKAALAAHRAKAEADKTLEQRALEASTHLATEKARAAGLEKALRGVADAEMAKVPEAIRATVLKHAGDDPTKQLELLRDLAPLAAQQAPAAPSIAAAPAVLPPAVAAPVAPPQAPAAPAAPAVLPPPANTMPANASPPPVNAPPKTHAEVYAALKADPARQFQAAAYLQKHMRQIYAAPTPNQPTK